MTERASKPWCRSTSVMAELRRPDSQITNTGCDRWISSSRLGSWPMGIGCGAGHVTGDVLGGLADIDHLGRPGGVCGGEVVEGDV